jgi:hypothetical protein
MQNSYCDHRNFDSVNSLNYLKFCNNNYTSCMVISTNQKDMWFVHQTTQYYAKLQIYSQNSWVFIWRHRSDGGSTLKQNTVIRVSRLFVLCISLVFGGKYMEFRIIFSLQYSINTFEVDPPSDSLHNAVVKPKNRNYTDLCFFIQCFPLDLDLWRWNQVMLSSLELLLA